VRAGVPQPRRRPLPVTHQLDDLVAEVRRASTHQIPVPAVEKVRFAVGGAEYEIDLNKKNAAFCKQLAPFAEDTAAPAGRPRAVSALLLPGCGPVLGDPADPTVPVPQLCAGHMGQRQPTRAPANIPGQGP
jgi:hypothetical protein